MLFKIIYYSNLFKNTVVEFFDLYLKNNILKSNTIIGNIPDIPGKPCHRCLTLEIHFFFQAKVPHFGLQLMGRICTRKN